MRELAQGTTQLVVLVVVFSVLDVVPTHHLDFSEICILFPLYGRMNRNTEYMHITKAYVEEIYFLQEFLFMIFQFAYHLDGERRSHV
jgi:hypothetical protein